MIYDVVMSAGVGLGPAASQKATMTENRWSNGGRLRDGKVVDNNRHRNRISRARDSLKRLRKL